MTVLSTDLTPKLDELGRWMWPDPDCECVRMMRRTGRLRVVLTAWLEEQIVALVDLPDEVIKQVNSPDAIRKESLRRFRHASFSLHVEEHFSRTKRDRDRIIYSMLRCKKASRMEELSIAIRRVKLILQPQQLDILKVLKVPRVVVLDLFLLILAIPSSKKDWPMPMRVI